MTAVLLLGMLPAAAPSTNPTFTSDLPERLDLYFKPTVAGTVAVLSWQQGHLGEALFADPALAADLSGVVTTASVDRVKARAAELVAAQITAGANAPAALVDEVFADVATAVTATACCAPDEHALSLHRPSTAADPISLYTARNGTHRWSPGSTAPAIPLVQMTLTLGEPGDAGLDSGLTSSKRSAIRLAVAGLAHVPVSAVTEHDAASMTHVWTPSIVVSDLSADWVNDNAQRRAVIRDDPPPPPGCSRRRCR